MATALATTPINPSTSEITMLTKLLRGNSSKAEKTDIKHLVAHAKTLKKQSTVWRKAKKAAESEGIVDIDGYFKKDFSGLLDKHARSYEKIVLLLKPAKPERDVAALKRQKDALKTVLEKLARVYEFYKAFCAGKTTEKARGLLKADGKSGGGKVLPQDKHLESALAEVYNVLMFTFDGQFKNALQALTPYVSAV